MLLWYRQHSQDVESGLRRRDTEMLTHAFGFLQRLMGQYPDMEDVEVTIEETAQVGTVSSRVIIPLVSGEQGLWLMS